MRSLTTTAAPFLREPFGGDTVPNALSALSRSGDEGNFIVQAAPVVLLAITREARRASQDGTNNLERPFAASHHMTS